MSYVLAFASALRRASDAAFELLQLESDRTADRRNDDEFFAFVRDRQGARAAVTAAVRDVKRSAPSADDIEPPAGIAAERWLAGLLKHLDWLDEVGNAGVLSIDHNQPPWEHVAVLKEHWATVANELAEGASHLENLVIAPAGTGDVFDNSEWSILLALHKSHPAPLVIERLEAAIDTMAREAQQQNTRLQNVLQTISARTIQERLKGLIRHGYVIRRKGLKGGCSITAKGLAAIKPLL